MTSRVGQVSSRVDPVVKRALESTSRRWVAVAVFVAFAVASLPTSQSVDPVTLIAQVVCCVCAGLAVLWPTLAASLLGAIQVLMTVTMPNPILGPAVFAYSLVIAICAARGRRLIALVFALFYLTFFLIVASRMQIPEGNPIAAVPFWMAIVFAPLLFGEGIWRLQTRSERQRQEQALAAERERHAIARDLHDHLAYATTTMVMKADQARLRGGQDRQTLADLEYIAATGRSATADLRTMLALLREIGESDDRSTLDDIPAGLLPPTRLQEVLEAQRAKLAAFDFDINLAVSEDLASLPERQSAVLSRVLTEVASNITKHGDPGSEVSIMIDVSPYEIEAVLINKPRATPASTGHRGLGLLGLREIVNAVGGTLTSGPVGDRWINHLTLPLNGDDSA